MELVIMALLYAEEMRRSLHTPRKKKKRSVYCPHVVYKTDLCVAHHPLRASRKCQKAAQHPRWRHG